MLITPNRWFGVKILFYGGIIGLFAIAVRGQGAHYNYPFEIVCPTAVNAGGVVEFTVRFPPNVQQPDSTFNWTVSAGTIVSGQGTSTISVDASGAEGAITATVDRNLGARHWVGVQSSGSCTTAVATAPQAVMVDEFSTGRASCEYIFMLLDRFYSRLAQEPDSRGIIIIYPDMGSKSSALRRQIQIRNHVQMRHYERERLTEILGPARENATTQFWIVPPGAAAPDAGGTGGGITLIDDQPVQHSLPFLYAKQVSDGIPGCDGNVYDLEAFAKFIGKMSDRTTAQIVIGEASVAAFRRTSRETVAELVKAGLARRSITIVFRRVRPNQVREFVELWVIEAKPRGKKHTR